MLIILPYFPPAEQFTPFFTPTWSHLSDYPLKNKKIQFFVSLVWKKAK